MKTIQERIFLLLVSVSILQVLFYASLMPVSIASHFNGDGEPNGWSSRTAFLGLYSSIFIMVVLLFRFMPGFLSRFPDAMINLPNKDYWLAPGRRAATFSTIKDRFICLGNGLMTFLIVMFQLVVQANLTEGSRLNSKALWILLSVFVVFTISWTVNLIRMLRTQAGQAE